MWQELERRVCDSWSRPQQSVVCLWTVGSGVGVRRGAPEPRVPDVAKFLRVCSAGGRCRDRSDSGETWAACADRERTAPPEPEGSSVGLSSLGASEKTP